MIFFFFLLVLLKQPRRSPLFATITSSTLCRLLAFASSPHQRHRSPQEKKEKEMEKKRKFSVGLNRDVIIPAGDDASQDNGTKSRATTTTTKANGVDRDENSPANDQPSCMSQAGGAVSLLPGSANRPLGGGAPLQAGANVVDADSDAVPPPPPPPNMLEMLAGMRRDLDEVHRDLGQVPGARHRERAGECRTRCAQPRRRCGGRADSRRASPRGAQSRRARQHASERLCRCASGWRRGAVQPCVCELWQREAVLFHISLLTFTLPRTTTLPALCMQTFSSGMTETHGKSLWRCAFARKCATATTSGLCELWAASFPMAGGPTTRRPSTQTWRYVCLCCVGVMLM
jgi:hypothetical protein